MSDPLSSALQRAQALLQPLRRRLEPARAALELLDRDLLPRLAGADSYLVAGIVGPNNAGKSALFNALVGRAVSPSMSTGGATRRLVGALHPRLMARLRAEPTLARFQLEEIAAGPALQATESSDAPASMLVVADESLPQHLMLIDTPDFDSILADNRMASESLLAVADLVVAVVTRHSYQNRTVVVFLEQWLAHGRPWILVYNEATDRATAAAHCAKLAADVGTAPLAAYWAPHELAVAAGAQPLTPLALEEGRPPLREYLLDLDESAEVKARAIAAANARLRDLLQRLVHALRDEAAIASAILRAAEDSALRAGVRIASAAMPGGPFVAAFRDVLDRRTNFLSRTWRQTLRQVRLGLETIPAALFGSRATADGDQLGLEKVEGAALRAAWPLFWEDLARDLGPEARLAARAQAPGELAAALDRDLAGSDRGEAARAAALAAIQSTPANALGSFRRECEALIEKALDQRGFAIDIQAAADVLTLVPIAVAAAVIVNTAGLGSDVAAAGGGAVSSFLVEKYYHLLGRGVMAEAQRRWTHHRGEQLAATLLAAVLPQSAPHLRAAVAENGRLADQIEALGAELARHGADERSGALAR